MKQFIAHPFASVTLGIVGGFLIASLFFITITSVVAAPTQSPPNGNPTFPLQGPQGPAGSNGSQGPTGPQGPQGTWAPNRCQVCIQACDWNGSGPCSSTCATEGNGWSSWGSYFGDVDGNDVYRLFFDCW